MYVITGKSGVGKTSILENSFLKNVFNADTFVKDILYKNDHIISQQIYNKWPEVKGSKKVDTKKLGKILFQDQKSLEYVHSIVSPYVKSWLKTLPENSIVEMASYINYENHYKKFFDKIILIERKIEDLSKFNHIINMKQPIKTKNIKYDFKIENNSTIKDAVSELKKIVIP